MKTLADLLRDPLARSIILDGGVSMDVALEVMGLPSSRAIHCIQCGTLFEPPNANYALCSSDCSRERVLFMRRAAGRKSPDNSDIPAGTRFGSLVVVSSAGTYRNGRTHALCRCDCGKTATARPYQLRAGRMKCCPNAHPCVHCGKEFRAGPMHLHLRRCGGADSAEGKMRMESGVGK